MLKIDDVGQKYGKLTVTRKALSAKGTSARLLCVCDCGNEVVVLTDNVRSGNTQSCGCHKEKILRASPQNKTHGRSNEGVYNSWIHMRGRCLNKNDAAYRNYGGRGITICDRWMESFENFYADMGDKPSKKHSLDRIDNDGPYSPENCRWTTSTVQTRNRRNTHMITHNGKTLCVSDWAKEIGVKRGSIFARLRNGWTIEDALSPPSRISNNKKMVKGILMADDITIR